MAKCIPLDERLTGGGLGRAGQVWPNQPELPGPEYDDWLVLGAELLAWCKPELGDGSDERSEERSPLWENVSLAATNTTKRSK
jgi:hypothetical protein